MYYSNQESYRICLLKTKTYRLEYSDLPQELDINLQQYKLVAFLIILRKQVDHSILHIFIDISLP